MRRFCRRVCGDRRRCWPGAGPRQLRRCAQATGARRFRAPAAVSSRRRCVATHDRRECRRPAIARRLPRRRHLPGDRRRRHRRHRLVGSDRAELGEPHVQWRIVPSGDDSAAMETIRATGEVSADGQTFTAQFTLEITGDRFPTGQYGPGHVTATRITVEPMGTPVGPLQDLFAQVGGPSTPAGTEAVATAPAGTEPAGTAAGGHHGGQPRHDRDRAGGHHADGHRTGGHHAGGRHDGLTAESTPVVDVPPNR